MKRSICSLLLILCLLAQLWIPATASGSMTTSSDGKAFINEHQGGASYSLSAAEKQVNSFKSKYGLSLKQSQFDALVDFVVAYPNHNILSSNYKIERVLSGGSYSDAELASALTSWVKGSDGEVSSKNLNRRIREAKLFLYGSYDGNCDANFRYVLFNPNGGELDDNSVICYPYNTPYNNLPIATNGSKYFAGWYTLAGSEGVHIYNSTYADSNRTLYAHWSDNEVPNPNTGSSGGTGNFDYPDLKVSESLIAFIKAHEGFSSYRYWDYGQYTIGYGTRWDTELYPDGTITEEEADYELRKELAKFEEDVDRLLKKGTVSHNQHQYDAIISFTFNLGNQWMSSSNRIYQYILFGHPSELEFLDAMGSWASAGGQVIRNLMQRRMDEADMYLNGNYQRDSKTYFGMHLTVNTSDKTALIDKSGKSYAMFYAKAGQPIGTMPKATRSGYTFLGWFDGNGVQYTKDTIAPATVSTLRAKWKEGAPEPPVTEPPVEIPNETGFTDIPANAWYIPYVTEAVERGLLNGLGKNRFGPSKTMTRAMVVTVLHRLAGSPESTAEHPFTDVPEGQWYAEAVAWAYEEQIANGVSEDRFGVNEAISRQQLVTMLYRFAQIAQIDTNGRADLGSFADTPAISSYASEPFQWAVAMEIINGDDGCLLPNNSATRAQCAKIMVLFSDLMP